MRLIVSTSRPSVSSCLLPDDDASAGLVSSQDEHLSNLHMLWGIGGIDSYISDIVTCQRLDALIEFGCAFCISMETDVAEIGFYQSWFEIGDTYCRIGYIDAKSLSALTAAFVAQ